MKITKLSDDAKKSLQIAKDHHWGFRVVGEGRMIKTPVRTKDWLFIPVVEDESTIKSNAMRRIKTLEKEGVKIQGLILES